LLLAQYREKSSNASEKLQRSLSLMTIFLSFLTVLSDYAYFIDAKYGDISELTNTDSVKTFALKDLSFEAINNLNA